MFRWRPHPYLFGVPLSLTATSQRMDWDRPAGDLGEWVESVDLWLMEDVENGFLYRARRRAVDDYIELRGPDWPIDWRFWTGFITANESESWLRVPFVARDGLDPQHAVARRDDGSLIAWVTAYENNSTGSPYLGQATVVAVSPTVAEIDFIEFAEGVPATLVLDLVRIATHAAADHGATVVATDLEIDVLATAGFRPDELGRMTVQTHFLDEDPGAADRLLEAALADPGRWGQDRDQADRYLPGTRLGRIVHRLRYGPTGGRRRVYAG